MKKILVIVFLVLLFIFALSFTSYLNNRDINTNKIVGIDREQFAMYKQDENGNYIKITDSNAFPEGYELNVETSVCVNKSGATVEGSLNFLGNSVSVTSNETVFCSLYFDMISAQKLNMTVITDGNTGTVPNTSNYTKSLVCDNDISSIWNTKYNRLEINGASSFDASCTLNYTKQTATYPSLITTVQEDDEIVHEYIEYEILNESDYGTISTYYSTAATSTSGTAVSNAYSFSDDAWTTQVANMTSSTSRYYHFKFNIPENGNYQLCYTMSAGNANNRLYIYKNTTAQALNGSTTYLTASTTAAKNACLTFNSLTTSDYIKVTNRAYNTKASVTFYLKRIFDSPTDYGYRYEGKTPSNYVWFNNEMWRIIGSVPTCTASGCSTSENLVKIIRAEPIGTLAFDAKNSGYTGSWGANTLYTLLNQYYFGKKDGTGTEYCKFYSLNYTSLCNYNVIGINPDEYSKMLRSVYWNTGASTADVTAEVAYVNETAVQTVNGYVGLMAASDYGFAASQEYHTVNMSSYYTNAITATNWLYNGREWTITAYPNNSTRSLSINNGGFQDEQNGQIIDAYSLYGYAIRPVVYLNSSVYVTAGNGAIDNPFIIGIN